MFLLTLQSTSSLYYYYLC